MRLFVYTTLLIVIAVVCAYMAKQNVRCVYTPDRRARQEIVELRMALNQMRIDSPANFKQQYYSGKQLYELLNTNGFHALIAGHPHGFLRHEL